MKSKECKALNRQVRRFNKKLSQDVFGNRFWIRQVRKDRCDGIGYYMYELRDREQPERNYVYGGWFTDFYARFTVNALGKAMNDFIISSDFWQKYRANLNEDKE